MPWLYNDKNNKQLLLPLNLQGDSLASKGLDENLHICRSTLLKK